MNITVQSSTPADPQGQSQAERPALLPIGHMLPFRARSLRSSSSGACPTTSPTSWCSSSGSRLSSPRSKLNSYRQPCFLVTSALRFPLHSACGRWGYKAGILTGLCLFATGTLMFWPAAVIGRYWLMLSALFVVWLAARPRLRPPPTRSLRSSGLVRDLGAPP